MKDTLKKIGAKKTKHAYFHLFDFHVHSIASKDVLFEKRSILSIDEQNLISQIKITNKTTAKDAEDLVLKEANIIEKYYDLLKHKSDKTKENNEWSIIGITDHNVFNFSSQLSKYSIDGTRLSKNQLIILPGVELEIEFPFKEKQISCHILLLFKPATEYNDIFYAINELNGGKWVYGEVLKTDSIFDFIKSIRHHHKTESLAISAHINSTKGIRGEAKDVITKIEANIANLLVDEEKNKEDIEYLKSKITDPESVDFEILNLIGKCGFDGLQVSSADDSYFFKKINKIDPNQGRSTPLLCSDAHRIESIFSISDESRPYIKISNLSSNLNLKTFFEEVRTSFKLGEARITYSPLVKSTFWIDGIRLQISNNKTNDFWPFSTEGDDKEFIIPFSRNLNCIIGGRGSGKSAIIESLCFVYDNKDEYSKSANQTNDWYNRASRVLQNCSIDSYTKYLDDENYHSKKCIVHKRSFFKDNKHIKAEIYNLNGESISLNKLNKLPSVDYYRFNEIEEYTKPKKLRELFDNICGGEIALINSEIFKYEDILKSSRNSIIELCKKQSKLFVDKAPLLSYLVRFVEYEKANKKDIKEKFKTLDNVKVAETKILFIEDEFNKINISSVNSFIEMFSTFLDGIEKQKLDNDELNIIITKFKKEMTTGISFEKEFKDALEKIEEIISIIKKRTDELNIEIDLKKELAKHELRENGIDSDQDYRQNCKENFEESDKYYRSYISLTHEIIGHIERRQETYEKLKALSNKRSEIRENTAKMITDKLSRHLDERLIIIEAKANTQSDKSAFSNWLSINCFPSGTPNKSIRLLQLDHLSIDDCITNFFTEDDFNFKLFENGINKAGDGRINYSDANGIQDCNVLFSKFNYSGLDQLKENEKEIYTKLPEEIKAGLFRVKIENTPKYLDLFSLTNDDEPQILLNDRPQESSTLRDIKNLSPGQRCSAILPIILTNGEGPLIIDQPEDNLDNKLVREVIVNILTRIKLQRQVIIATHNPNLPVLGDAENVIALQAIGEGQCDFISISSLDEKATVTSITEIMEGGREAFQYRSNLYQEHWKDGAEK